MPKGLFSVEVVNSGAVARIAGAITSTARDLRPFWREEFAPKYYGVVQDLFATGGRARGAGGRFAGGAWKALTPKYKVWKDAHYPGQPILVREGDLRESMRWGGMGPGPGGIFDAQPSFVIAGTAIPYAAHVNAERPFLPAPDTGVFAPMMKSWLLRTAKGKK
jgi:hypothetical protein